MHAIMVQGTSSSSGKSLIATALCRHFANLGVRVAPFKAQNMSNNARVVDGGEIGVAQYLQALAARATPDVRMNPVLVKPESHTSSQVVLCGQVDREISALPWRERGSRLWEPALAALRELQAEYELIVLEGAGSPAEINLRASDLANMRSAQAADAKVILVTDIDRGGAFAHLFGTWALVGEDERARLAGFVLNKFRGDQALLAPAPAQLAEMTGMAAFGVVPMLAHGLPDEDGAALRPTLPVAPAQLRPDRPLVAIVRYPMASNLDEFKALEAGAEVRFVRAPDELEGADLLILPGSKHTTADLRWLRATGLADAVLARAAAGQRVLGICGGLQMLGRRLVAAGDPVENDADGLGLLRIATRFGREKLTRRTHARFAATLPEPWTALAGIQFDGYEIRQGVTEPLADSTAGGALAVGLTDTAASGPAPSTKRVFDASVPGFVAGSVLGIAVHGLFESPAAWAALAGGAPAGAPPQDIFEALAHDVMAGLDVAAIEALVR